MDVYSRAYQMSFGQTNPNDPDNLQPMTSNQTPTIAPQQQTQSDQMPYEQSSSADTYTLHALTTIQTPSSMSQSSTPANDGTTYYIQTTADKVPYQQLRNRYGDEKSMIELWKLLDSWNLGELYDYFVEQHLFIGILRHMPNEMAQNLFSNTNVPHGVRVEFYFRWSQWVNAHDQTTSNSDETVSKSTTKNQTPINLNSILKSNTYGKCLMQSYEANGGAMDEDLRKLLLDSILHYCIENEYDLKIQDCASLSKQICDAFPGESVAYYYIERKGAAPLGKLYYKFRNWKNNKNKLSKTKKAKTSTFAVYEEEPEHIRALKYDIHAMSYDEKLRHWAGCVSTRMNDIRETEKSKKHIVDIWPLYKAPDGYRLVESDFIFLHGTKNGLLDDISEFCNLMLDKIFPKHLGSFKDQNDKDLLRKVTAERTKLPKDSVHATVFRLIQSLLPPSRLKVANEKGKFYSIEESRNLFMTICPTETKYREMFDSKLKAESSIAPLITLIGSLEKPRSFMVDFESISYKLFDFARAVDVCFKAYYVFNIAHPEGCDAIWDFLNRKFYGLKDVDEQSTKPATYALLKEIELEASKSSQASDVRDENFNQPSCSHTSK